MKIKLVPSKTQSDFQLNTMYKEFLEYLVLPLGDIALGSSFMRELHRWRRIQWGSKQSLEELQLKNLDSIITHSLANVPYYSALGIKRLSNPIQTLKQFPVLTKQTVRNNLDRMIMGNRLELEREVSSGSSGFWGEIYMDKRAQSITHAIQTLWWEWAGYSFGFNLLQLGMTLDRGIVKRVKDKLLRVDYNPAFDLDPQRVALALEKYRGLIPVIFGGYASGLYVYAKVAQERKIDDIRFKSIISWGDKMFPHYRSLIEKQFHAEVFDNYGCTEGCMIAGECEKHRYHIMTPHVYLELLDEKGNEVSIGELGYVVVTRLDSYAMPLIRYYLGDLAVKADMHEQCSCGRAFPILEKIVGRDTDIVKTRSGKHLIVHFFTGIFEYHPEISQFKVIQKNFNGIEIEYIPGKDFTSAILDMIAIKIQDYIQESFSIKFIQVDSILPTASGKPQLIQSFLENFTCSSDHNKNTAHNYEN